MSSANRRRWTGSIERRERVLEESVNAIGVEQAVVEGHEERRILGFFVRPALGQTRGASPRQLPTDHDYDGDPNGSIREYQSDQPSNQPLRPPPVPPR